MATDLKTTFINEFKGGMNSDLSYDVLLPNQYVFGKNIRITTNLLLNQIQNTNYKEGSLCAIENGIKKHNGTYTEVKSILATSSIENVGVIITRNQNDTWSVYRVNSEDTISIKNIFTSVGTVQHDNKFSIVLNKEINNILKLYIADGVHLIMSIDVNDDEYNSKITNETQLISNQYNPSKKIYIEETLSGCLYTGQVQYTYRFYKKYGIKSKLAPLTNKIQVIDEQKSTELGNAEGTQTGVGFRLSILIDDEIKNIFDKLQIYRIHYKKPNVNADIDLIYDDDINQSEINKINDVGLRSLKTYSIDEFVILDGMAIIPLSIEQNQNYMFAANVTDDTVLNLTDVGFDARAFQFNKNNKIVLFEENDIEYNAQHEYLEEDIENIPVNISLNKYSDINLDSSIFDENSCCYDKDGYFGGTGKNVSWRFITTPIELHTADQITNKLAPTGLNTVDNSIYYLKSENNEIVQKKSGSIKDSVFTQHSVCRPDQISYENAITSSMFRSLKRGETYRYGIILRDNEGRKSDVNWIADIKTPTVTEFPNTKYSDKLKPIESENGYREFTLEGAIHSSERWYTLLLYEYGWLADTMLTYSTQPLKSDVILFKKGHKIRFLLRDNEKIKISASNNYIFYQKGFWDDGYPFLLNLEATGTAESINYALQQSFDSTSFPVENIMRYDGCTTYCKIVLNGIGEILLSSDDPNADDYYYEIPFDTTGYIETHMLFNITRMHASLDNMYVLCYTDWDTIGTYKASFIIQDLVEHSDVDDKIVDGLIGYPIGIQFDVHDLPSNITSYEIVRCEKPLSYTRNIMQCVASRPIKQQMGINNGIKRYSPYYSHYILNAQPYAIHNVYGSTYSFDGPDNKIDAIVDLEDKKDRNIFQIQSPEILTLRNSTIQHINKNTNLEIKQLCFHSDSENMPNTSLGDDGLFIIEERTQIYKWSDSTDESFDKSSCNNIYPYYNSYNIQNDENVDLLRFKIKNISDTQTASWESGFSNVLINSDGGISYASKNYKSYTTILGEYEYLNWNCTGMYDMKAYLNDSESHQREANAAALLTLKEFDNIGGRPATSYGLVGPGPLCYVLETENKEESPAYKLIKKEGRNIGINGAYLCNITHKANQFAGYSNEDKKYDIYYGFGNHNKYISEGSKFDVFDGDVYIVPFEIVLMYKAYNMNDYLTLQSGLFIYYVPVESKINTFFDYGANYRNTSSKMLLTMPGEIVGVALQTRPLHQYNDIYSDNNISNDIFTYENDEIDTDTIKHRIFHSDLKISGEFIDNWLHFLPFNYIDVNTKYGEITHLMSNAETLYCWQTNSFGRINVNERSLIQDNNSNSILLGLSGVLLRMDYVDTHHGMKLHHHVALAVDNNIYWIDADNRSIMMSSGKESVNLSERLNVQNVINSNFKGSDPTIDYDVYNQELLCRCLNDDEQLIINVKLNVATSIYDRKYTDVLCINNTLYGISPKLELYKYNNIEDSENISYMPSSVTFVINPSVSYTKVYDNQELVLSGQYLNDSDISSYVNSLRYKFRTNIYGNTQSDNILCSIKEGNVKYCIPRLGNEQYGNRYRGKWMEIQINNDTTDKTHAISHIITKFRQSIS